MAVGFVKDDGKRRVKFLTDVAHEGVDYGPQCETDEATIDVRWANTYSRQGRAVILEGQAPVRTTTKPPTTRPEQGSGSSESAVDLHRLNKPDLLALAQGRGVETTDVQTKAEIIAAIEAAESGPSNV